MKHLYVTIVILIITAGTLYAAEVSKSTVSAVAENFYLERFDKNINNGKSAYEIFGLKKYMTTVIYFVNYNNGGWVAISADNAVRPILAYSFVGKYQEGDQPENFKAWIKQYEDQILWSIENKIEASNEITQMWNHYTDENQNNLRNFAVTSQIEPLLVTTWDQGRYYNEMCPEDSGPGGHCYAGCVPTAMGQICNYFGFPETGVGSYSYDCPPYGNLSADFENSIYNFNSMPVSLNTNNIEVAQLLYHLGVSCDLVYGPGGSGMYNHKAAYSLKTFFKYNPSTQYVFRDSTTMDWDSLIVNHLNRQIPMYYAGWSIPHTEGHAFVCDGHQDSTYYHFNWGWSGSYDGYFYTDNLNPGGNNFNLAQELIINCFPDTANYQYPMYCSGNDTIKTLSASFDDGSGPIFDYLDNLACSWLIEPTDSVLNINLEFIKFDILAGDTLYIFDGNNDSSVLIGAYSGNELPENIESSSDKLFIRFVTDNQEVSGGWMINYTCSLPQFCSNTTCTLSHDTISDGSGRANYQNNTFCYWIIPNNGMGVSLEFLEFKTEEGGDFVTVYDGTEIIGEFSGQELPPNIVATNNQMVVSFSTNFSVTDKGWTAIYSTATFVDEVIPMQVNVYPIPANNVLNINIHGNKFATAQLYSAEGRLLKETCIIANSSETIHVNDIPGGVYFLKIICKNEIITKKITIQH